MTRRWEDLPDEIWESIIRYFDPHHRNFQSFSLVCKRFRSLSYRLRTALALSAHAPPSISFFLLRFPNLTRIDLVHRRPDLEILIALLSKSHLKLQSLHLSNQDRYPAAVMKELGQTMKTLKSLTCSFFGVLLDQDLVAIGDSFPNLEELDISYPQGDDRGDEYWITLFEDGIDQMAFKLRELRAINISGPRGTPKSRDGDLSHFLLQQPVPSRIRATPYTDAEIKRYEVVNGVVEVEGITNGFS